MKNKAIPIIITLAASFILSSQPVFAARKNHSRPHEHKISREHKRDINENKAKHSHTHDGFSIQRERINDSSINKRSRSIGEFSDYQQNNGYDDYISDGLTSHLNNNYSNNEYFNYNDIMIDELPLEYIDIDPISEAVIRPNIINSIEEVNNIRINGSLPQIVSMNARAAERINTRIRNSFLHLVNTGHRNIEADFDVYNWGGMTSLVVRYQMGDRHVVNTFVFDHVSKNEVTLRNLLGRDFISYVNRRIAETKRADEEGTYFITNFRSIRANQNFYIRDGKIHIVFEQGHVASSTRGVVEFVIPMESLNYSISTNQFVVKNGTKFVPASIARRFGMDVNILQSGVMEIRTANDVVRINVHNDLKNPNEVIYINGYDVALSQEILKQKLGITLEPVPNSREIMVSHTF